MVKIYNTLTRQKEEFKPLVQDRVAMYVCGPNLYDPCHVGHAFSYIVFDTLKRYLRYRGYQVRHVQNFTDIEDRIIAKAQNQQTTIQALAETYIARFYREMDALNIERADAYPRATGVIGTIIQITQGLIEKGYAYQVEGDVYFRVRKDDDYGKLSHRRLDEMEAGARIAVDERKDDPLDFALWKASKPGEPSWDSPWGKGRPGWHIECSAMNLETHGEQIDIHGGGHDVIFPHHENEIAQSESYTGKTFARYWMHNALLRLSGDTSAEDKMSRHVGNTLWVKDALERHEPDAMRLYLLSTHYRTPLAWRDDDVDATARGLDRWRAALKDSTPTPTPTPNPSPASRGGEDALTQFAQQTREKFIAAMDDDLGSPQAIAALHELVREINRARAENAIPDALAPAQATLRELAGILGLTLTMRESSTLAAAPFIELLIAVRKDLRAAKQYALSDKVRDELAKLGIALEDGPQGTTWKSGA
ncbi:MAG: cysteine--tRNA ligase [Chloroflexi bacterium]|nr:cysteine--tRNA ligase [Chloroflexota bacterium]